MDQIPLMELAGIIVTGISAQWLAWRLKLPSILLLMVFGFVAGPLTGFLHPGQLMGPLLSHFISMKDYLAPDRLLEVISLMLVVLIFTISEIIQEESGLLAATLMGVVLANQNIVNITPIIKFKEDLRTLLISLLFIILVARLPIDYFYYINLNSALFLGTLIFIARPAAVILSTQGLGLSWQEKVFIAWMAPRGIVAAAVASVFGLFLSEQGMPQAEMLAPVTFFAVAGTVAIYGLTAGPLARTLHLASRNQKGFLIAGAHCWARKMASIIRDQGLPVLLVDTNSAEIAKAYQEGLPTYHGSIIS